MSDSEIESLAMGESRENILEARSMTFPVNNVPYSPPHYSIFVTYSDRELQAFFLSNRMSFPRARHGVFKYHLIHMIYFETNSSL